MSSITEVKEDLQMSFQELSDATNAFSDQNLIAKGGFGKVYRGVSVKHGNIAVKMLDPALGQGDHEFRTEIELLSVYRHENIVSLVGFCDEDGKKILVYKYESNGSLDQHLGSKDLTWIQRLQICLDAARGLQYLHDDVGLQHRILHRDVKSSNILLDEKWKAKISDFGLSRVGPANKESTFLISKACGTFGYIDPEYMNTGYLTQKSDVYSFGVVLFEVLCGRLSRLPSYKDERQYLTICVQRHYKRKTLDRLIYFGLQNQITTASLLTFSTIAYQCLRNGNERPTMKKVVEQLQRALDNQLAPIDLWFDDDHGFAAHHQGQSGSLASSSQPIPSFSSSSQSWTYDVFISCRKISTQKRFEDYLCNALRRQHVITFKNAYGFTKERYIDPSHIKVIQESRIVIIIFSVTKYAMSTWCLDELECAMKNIDERGQIVIPIINGVEPAQVKSETDYWSEEFVNDNHNKIESWRKAFVRATDLPGWLVENRYGGKRKQIQEIVDRISIELLSLMQRPKASAHTDQIGIDARMQELKLLLKVGTGGVHKVGISGMWGSGKSTLASCIYEEIRHEFEGCCFVKNVRDRSRMHGLKVLQEEILSNVLNIKVMLTDTKQGTDMMERRLCRNSVLVVLDDVDHIEHLEMLVGSRKWFGDGSRIIITTRNQGLINAHRYLTHNVRMLDVKEAIELISRRAFGESIPAQGFEEVSLNMVSKFGGHPSTLITLGSVLHGKDTSVWVHILNRLEGIPVDEILKKFETPDDGLTTNSWLHFLLEGAEVVSP